MFVRVLIDLVFVVFEPVTHKVRTFSNETSARKRINAMTRTTPDPIQHHGLLHQLLLPTKGFSAYSPPQQAVRDIFSSIISSPHGAPIESRGGTGQINEQGAFITPMRQENGSSTLPAAIGSPASISLRRRDPTNNQNT
jgi:hypothetical protein